MYLYIFFIRYVGCGLNIPELWPKLKVLELGSGCGRDGLFMSKLVGQNGKIIGIDMGEDRVSNDARLSNTRDHRPFMLVTPKS